MTNKTKYKYLNNWIIRFLLSLFIFFITLTNINDTYAIELNNTNEIINNTSTDTNTNNTWINNNSDTKETDNITNTTTNTNWTLDYLKDRTKKISDQLWINKETPNEEKLETIDNEIKDSTTEKNILLELKDILKNQTNTITKDIQIKEDQIKEINNELNNATNEKFKNEEIIKKLNENIILLKAEVNSKKKDLENITNDQIVTENKIKVLLNDISELKIYKDKYQELVKKDNAENLKSNFYYILIYVIALIIYWLFMYFFNKHKKLFKEKKDYIKLNRLVMLEILIWMWFVLLTIIYIVIINPSIWVIFVIIWWSIILSLKSIISSFFASFQVVTNYKLWDKIIINKNIWEIKSINLLNTTLTLIDENNLHYLNKTIKIPNSLFSEQEVSIIKWHKDEIVSFSFRLDLEKLNISYNDFIKKIDEIFFLSNIKYIETSTKKRYYIELSSTLHMEYDIKIKFLWKENQINISNKIINLIEEFNKQDEKTKEENLNNKNKKSLIRNGKLKK